MYLIYLVAILTVISFGLRYARRNITPKPYKKIPVVKGAWPLVGHGFQTKDILEFIRRCYKTYGKIFRIKIFMNDIVVVCDRTLVKEYFGAKENEMSLYDVLNRLYFVDAFTDNPSVGSQNILVIKNIIKKIGARYKEFVPKILSEATLMTKRLIEKDGAKVKLSEEMIRFVSYTSAKCFVGYSMTDNFYYYLMKFAHLQNSIVILTYFFPKFLIRATVGKLLAYYRHKMTKILEPEIRSYRYKPTKNKSFFIRSAVDYELENGTKYTDKEIADLIVCLLYVSSENTALGTAAAITELSRAPEFWDRIKAECQTYLDKNDLESLLKSPLLDAIVMETARLNSHMFAMNRKPIEKKILGDYWVGDCSAVALCEPMLMNFECAGDIFENPEKFNPDRFIGQKHEPKVPSKVMTWGSGIHLCPGKKFAIYEIKMAIAMITTHFARPEISKSDLGEMNYFSPSAFAERDTKISFVPLKTNEEIVEDDVTGNAVTIKSYNGGGYLIRGYLSENDQEKLLSDTLNLAKQNKYLGRITSFDEKKAFPIAYYNLAYTNTSNCDSPDKWFNVALDAMHFLEKCILFNSVYCQLFSDKSEMAIHKDQYVGFGVSVSIGDSADFVFGDDLITLTSGDIFVADFSKVDHGISKIYSGTAPDFFKDYDTFGRTRLSVQIRSVDSKAGPKMSDEKFLEFLAKSQ